MADDVVASEELKKMNKDVMSALSSLREASETKNAETLNKVESFFTKYEDENAKLVSAHAEQQKKEAETKEALEKLEAKLVSAQTSSEEDRKALQKMEMILAKGAETGEDKNAARASPEYKNFFNHLTAGQAREIKGMDLDYKTLRTDGETSGGYLIPQIMDNEIRRNITEISPVRMHARVRMAPGKTMDIPRRLALLTAYYEGESEPSQTDQSVYGSEQVTLYRQTVTVPATLDMMVSSAFNLEQEIAADVGESFGKGEGTNFVTGTGTKGPQGFVADARCEVVTTATTGEVDFTDMAEIAGKLKSGQNPWWYMNRRTLAKMWQIKSTIGVPIWQPVAGNTPATIWGFPYDSNMIDLDDAQNGSNAKPIVFADLRRAYEIFDMLGISVVRDDLTRKKEAITEWTFRRYNTGRVILPEAIKVLKVK